MEKTIEKKASLIIPVGPDGKWRMCWQCVNSNRECDFCEKKKIRISRVLYACPDFEDAPMRTKRLSKEELIRRAKEERMLNYILTAMCNCATATQKFLIDFCSYFEKKKAETEWRHSRMKAANDILKAADKMQTIHAQFFQEDMNKVHTDHGTKEYDSKAYDNHQEDANELCRLIMLYIDRCWGNEEAANKVVEFIENLETGNIFSDEDIERYRLKH